MFVTNWISTTKIQKISEITNFFRHYFLSRTEVIILLHQQQLDINRAVGTSRSRYRACRRHRCRRYGVREGLLLIQVVFTKKVQMKRSVTGDEADGCCPQRKSHCPTLVGRKTKALYGKADQEEFRFNKSLTFPFFLLFKNSKQSIHYRHKTNNISFKIINIVYCKTRWEITPVFVCDIQECNTKEYCTNTIISFK